MLSTIIMNTAPFWTAIFAYYALGDKVSGFEVMCICGCFAGVVTISINAPNSEEYQDGQVSNSSSLVGLFFSMTSALCFSGIYVITRKLKDLDASIILFHLGFQATTLFLIFDRLKYIFTKNYTTTWPSVFYLSFTQVRSLAAVAIMNTLAQYFATWAFQGGKTALMALVGLTNVVYSLIIDVTLWNTSFKVAQLIGALIVCLFNVLVVV